MALDLYRIANYLSLNTLGNEFINGDIQFSFFMY